MDNPSLSRPSAGKSSILSKNDMSKCQCGSGKWAVFGFGVKLRSGEMGKWRCSIDGKCCDEN